LIMYIYLARGRNRESVVEKAKSRPSPSAGAKLDKLQDVQKLSQADAIYNHRPLSLSAESITIYHSVFTEFINDISAPLNSLDFGHEELAAAADFMQAAIQFYKIQDFRITAMRKAVGSTLDKELFTKSVVAASQGSGSTSAEPDGLLTVVCSMLPNQPMGYYGAQETKNESGEGGSDSVALAECDYRAIVSRDEVTPFYTLWTPLNASHSTQRFEKPPAAPCFWSQLRVHFLLLAARCLLTGLFVSD